MSGHIRVHKESKITIPEQDGKRRDEMNPMVRTKSKFSVNRGKKIRSKVKTINFLICLFFKIPKKNKNP